MTNTDIEHLNLLAIFHYIVGGLGVAFSCTPLLHVAMGLVFVLSGDVFGVKGSAAPQAVFGWLFVVMGTAFFLFGEALSILMIVSGRKMAKRTNYIFSFVMACIACVLAPFGTVLGIFTIIVLSKDSVKRLYGRLPSVETSGN